jgi:hypothetical protein
MKMGKAFILLLFSTSVFASMDPILLEKELATHFNIYLLKDDRKSDQDKIFVTGSEGKGFSAEISYWHSLQSRDPTVAICEAYRWILFGRGDYGKGAYDAFTKYSSLQKIELKLVDIQFDPKRGNKIGEILPKETVIPYLKISVDRKSLLGKSANWDQLRDLMNAKNCVDMGAKYIDSRWFDQDYIRTGKK